jgi:hypothetical protein
MAHFRARTTPGSVYERQVGTIAPLNVLQHFSTTSDQSPARLQRQPFISSCPTTGRRRLAHRNVVRLGARTHCRLVQLLSPYEAPWLWISPSRQKNSAADVRRRRTSLLDEAPAEANRRPMPAQRDPSLRNLVHTTSPRPGLDDSCPYLRLNALSRHKPSRQNLRDALVPRDRTRRRRPAGSALWVSSILLKNKKTFTFPGLF